MMQTVDGLNRLSEDCINDLRIVSLKRYEILLLSLLGDIFKLLGKNPKNCKKG